MSIISLLALANGLTLPEQPLDIANRVAGNGRAQCTSYHVDGTTGPCLPRFLLDRGSAVNGSNVGERITFTHAAAKRLTPDEFALLAGHEIAHWHLRHTHSTPDNELEADRLGAVLACKAGFDPVAGSSLFRFLRRGKTHPRSDQRRAAVKSVGCPSAVS